MKIMQAKTEELVTADYANSSVWGDNDPSVFEITFDGKLEGEFQITNGYGPKRAPQVMRVRLLTSFVVVKIIVTCFNVETLNFNISSF